MAEGMRLEVTGLDSLRRDLRAVDKTLVRDLNKEIRTVVRRDALPEYRAEWGRHSSRIPGGLTVSLERGEVKLTTGSKGKKKRYAHASLLEYGRGARNRVDKLGRRVGRMRGRYPQSNTDRRVAPRIAKSLDEVVTRWGRRLGRQRVGTKVF